MDKTVLIELLDGLDPILADLEKWEGQVTEDSPIELRQKALASGFAYAAISMSRSNLIDLWGDPRG